MEIENGDLLYDKVGGILLLCLDDTNIYGVKKTFVLKNETNDYLFKKYGYDYSSKNYLESYFEKTENYKLVKLLHSHS